MNFSWNWVLKNKINIHHNTTCTYISLPPSLSEDDIPETSKVKCTGRFAGTGVDVVDVVETV